MSTFPDRSTSRKVSRAEAVLVGVLAAEWFRHLHAGRTKSARRIERELHLVLADHFHGVKFSFHPDDYEGPDVVFSVSDWTLEHRVDQEAVVMVS